MATLTRLNSLTEVAEQPTILPDVPAPFPVNELHQIRSAGKSLGSRMDNDSAPLIDLGAVQDAPSRVQSSQVVIHDFLPSIVYVQRSCLMTLNDLLSAPDNWNPIIPERQRSVSATPQGTNFLQNEPDSSTALKTLVANLRCRDPLQGMVEYPRPTTEAELIQELQAHIERVSFSLASRDATLAKALVSLLTLLHRFYTIGAAISGDQPQVSTLPSPNAYPLSSDLLENLTRQLRDLRLGGLSSQSGVLRSDTPPVLAVEATLLWSEIDESLETVLLLCRERAEDIIQSSMDVTLPPQYDQENYGPDAPPDYDEESRMSFDDTKSKDTSSLLSSRSTDEKMRMDFENITTAIDRLYRVAPQLQNQRVELKSTKVAQLERARQQGPSTSQRESSPDVRELDNILDLLSKASERSISDQTFVLEGGMQRRLEKAKRRDEEKREAFVAELVRRSGSGRLHSQDAEYQSRTRDPHALLTLPEFIRESIPSEPSRRGSNASLAAPDSAQQPSFKGTRTRSMSAPHLPWLRSGSRSPASGSQTPNKGKAKMTGYDPSVGFDVAYVAENHEHLRHILVFLQVSGVNPTLDIELEVIGSTSSPTSGETFIVRSGSQIWGPHLLPGRAITGKREVKAQKGWFEVKLPSPSSPMTPLTDGTRLPLLDASQLTASSPSSFVCASCSLPIVHSSSIHNYRDLPSEHWQELVDAWMCHADQKLHDHIAKHDFVPRPGEALVGGSYILFEEKSLSKANLYIAKESKRAEEWRLVRCLCGAVLGRCQQDTNNLTMIYRVLKYVVRPISSVTEPSRIPVSAYVVDDMSEFVQAHATYRFVILDEEDERPRMLMWLFKLNISIAYNTWAARTSPRNGSIHAAKVLFKLFKPSETPIDLNSVLNKYPGFPQAEYLYYPMAICRQIATLLKESNLAYPESLRTMTGLDVGWLRRA